MFLGHFAMGVLTKPLAPKMPVWILLLAPQFLDLVFIVLLLLGLEGLAPDGDLNAYGQFRGDILYSHSLVGALLISAFALWLGKRFWQTNRNGWILAGLSFSHWPVDLLVHHQDMPILPGNLGGLPLLGFGVWNYPYFVFGLEVLLAVVGVILYFLWSKREKPNRLWYLGPLIVLLLFSAQILSDVMGLPQ